MGKNAGHNPMFDQEWDIVARNRTELSRGDGQNGSLLNEYRNLLSDYERLLKMTKKISAISDAQGLVLTRRENDIRNLLDHANQGFLTVGPGLLVNKMHSRECTRILGRKIAGSDIGSLLWGDNPELQAQARERIGRAFAASERQAAGLLRGLPALTGIGGKRIFLEYKRIQSGNDHDKPLIMVILTDITEQLESEEKIVYLNSHDSLTSLYNRSYIETLLDKGPAKDHLPFSLLLIDMNGLKLANDVFGHREGDKLLKRASGLLASLFGEPATLARWGGDEFVVLLPNTDEASCLALAERLKTACDAMEPDPIKISMAIGSATLTEAEESLHGAYASAEKRMYRQKLLEGKRVRIEMMNGVSDALLAKGFESGPRQERLLEQAVRFAAFRGMPADSNEMNLLRDLVKLHDAGNLALPVHILRKPGPLDAEEWEIVKSHSEIGCRMAQSIGEWALAETILGMHERWDGSGYPYGLAGDQIPYLSRLLAVVEAYDVMTNGQVYKKAVSAAEAAREIKDAAGRQFDPELAASFLKWKGEAPAGK